MKAGDSGSSNICAHGHCVCARVSSLAWMKQKPFCSQCCRMLISSGPTARSFCGHTGNYDPSWPPHPLAQASLYFRMCGPGFPRTHSKCRVGTDDLATFQANVWTGLWLEGVWREWVPPHKCWTGRYLPQCVSLVSGQHLEWRKQECSLLMSKCNAD